MNICNKVGKSIPEAKLKPEICHSRPKFRINFIFTEKMTESLKENQKTRKFFGGDFIGVPEQLCNFFK